MTDHSCVTSKLSQFRNGKFRVRGEPVRSSIVLEVMWTKFRFEHNRSFSRLCFVPSKMCLVRLVSDHVWVCHRLSRTYDDASLVANTTLAVWQVALSDFYCPVCKTTFHCEIPQHEHNRVSLLNKSTINEGFKTHTIVYKVFCVEFTRRLFEHVFWGVIWPLKFAADHTVARVTSPPTGQ